MAKENDKTRLKPRAKEPLITLEPGTRLNEYEISKTLGIGGFGITYLAHDTHLHKDVAIKEYFPTQLAFRDSTLTVHAREIVNEEENLYQWGLDRVIQEARVLAQFDHPNLIRVARYFEANGTAYIVMDFAAGNSLKQVIKEHKGLEEAQFAPMLEKLMDGLRVVHKGDILHRDIKPVNIIVRDDFSPVLIDFGAAKQTLGNQATVATAFQSLGYTPLEQLGSAGKLGPYTDIYALAATSYCALTGRPPADCNDRVISDCHVPAVEAAKHKASPAFLKAIDWGLQLKSTDRPQTIDQWRDAFESSDATVLRKPLQPKVEKTEANTSRKDASGERPGVLVYGMVFTALLCIAGLAGWLFLKQSTDVIDSQAGAQQQSQQLVRSEPTNTPRPKATPAPTETPALISAEQRALDEQDFAKAQRIDSKEAYQLYIRLHPKGAFVSEARKK